MKTILNVKIDPEIKAEAFDVAKDMGVPLSTIINSFLKRLIGERTITLTAPLRPSSALIKSIKQVERDIKKGTNLSPVFTDPKDMDTYLNNL